MKIISATTWHQNVVLYTTSNYGGSSFQFGYGKYDISNLSELNLNDNTGSINIPIGMQVALFADPGFTGQAVLLTADVSDFGNITSNQYNGINLFHQVSSFIVMNAGDDVPVPFATWYTNSNYSGVCGSWGLGWAGGTGNKPTGIPDKSVSSIKISPHTKVTIYACGADTGTTGINCTKHMYITQSINDATNQLYDGTTENINDNAYRFHVEST